MAVFTIDLTPEDRALLEAHRVRLGARSHADAVRLLIRGSDGVPATDARPRVPSVGSRGTTVVLSPRRAAVTTTAPKPKITSRLKGEWKAP